MMKPLRDLFTSWRTQIAALWPSVEVDPTQEGRSDREQLIADLLEIEQRDRADVAAYQSRLNALGQQLDAAEQQAATLRQAIDVERGRRMAQNFERDGRINKIREALAAGCHAQVDAFLERVNADIEHWQRPHNVGPGVGERLTSLRRARQKAEDLRTAPIVMADLSTQLRRLEKGLLNVSREHRRGFVAANN